MLKILLKTPKSPPIPTRLFRVLGYFFAQTQPKNPFSSSSSSPTIFTPKEDTLYYRLVPAWNPSASVIPILDRWVTEAKPLHQTDLRRIIKQFRKYRRFKHALEISEWMGDMKILDLTPADVAIQLDLISKVHGLEQAEKYFDSLPESFRVIEVYGALLNCYADSKSLEKAEIIMQKMRELGYRKVLSYNVMMSLYAQVEKYDKLDSLMQEMEEKGINRDKYSFNIRLNAYVAASDIKGMKELLMKMEVNPEIGMDWNTYVLAAKGYLKVGDTEKAVKVLKKSEQLIRGAKVNYGYQVLLTVYAGLGKKRDVYRIWDLLKKFGKFRNMNYLAMISSLDKVDDLEGAEKVLEEWIANKTYSDIRLPNFLVTAYCKRSHMDKAELLIKGLAAKGFKPNASTWYRMARGYFKYSDKEKAVEMIKEAIRITASGETIDFPPLADSVEYLKQKGDIDRADELIQSLEERGPFPVDIKERIAECINRGNLASEDLSHKHREGDETLEEDTLEDTRFDSKQTY